MSEEKSPEDIVASALAHAMHSMGADTVVLMTQTNGKALTRFWGNRAEAHKMAISYAARLFAEMESKGTTEKEV
jgi:hypothetical protein